MSGMEMTGGEPGGSLEVTGQLTPLWLEKLIGSIIHPEPEPEAEL